MKIVSVTQTCSACPAQWEGKLDDGRMFYVRYRWGCLTVSLSSEPTDEVMDAVGGQEVVRERFGDGLDGVLSWEEVLPHLANVGITK